MGRIGGNVSGVSLMGCVMGEVRSKSRKEALENNEIFYVSEKPCIRGHVGLKYARNYSCVQCGRTMGGRSKEEIAKKKREFYDKHKEKIYKKSRERILKNHEAYKLYMKEYRIKNREKCKNLEKEWHKKNKDRARKSRRDYYLNNREERDAYIKRWTQENPEMKRAQNRNRKARMKNAIGKHTAKEVLELLEKQEWICIGCKTLMSDKKGCKKKYTVDHIIPLVKGGSNFISNIQLLCMSCNSSKQDTDLEEWILRKNAT